MTTRSLLVATAIASASAQAAHAEVLYGLLSANGTATQQLVTIDSTTRAVTSTVTLQIGSANNALTSIDVRPSTGQLYGYSGIGAPNNTRQLSVIDTTTGALTPVGSPFSATTINNAALDFNPVADAARLVGTLTQNQNLRVNPTTGAIISTDTSLAYAAGDPNAAGTPSIIANAYTNNVAGATATTLYDIDAAINVLTTQNPPNNGTLQTVGALGVDVGNAAFTGFDVSGATGTAYLSDATGSLLPIFGGPTFTANSLYTVNLATGAATLSGLITGVPIGKSVQDIAVAATPEPAALGLLAVGGLTAVRRTRRRA